MPTLKRKNANGQWEYIQVSGLDVSQLKDEVDSVATSLADMTTQLKDEVDSVATSLADMTTQLTDIVKVNAHSLVLKAMVLITIPLHCKVLSLL
jgi:methyl-accepting chemotaxis protein